MIKKPVPPLNAYQWKLLRESDNDLLRLLIEIKNNKDFASLKDLISRLEDIEKNIFFAQKEFQMDDATLGKQHAISRGKIQGMKDIIYLIYGAQTEVERREDITRKKLNEEKRKKEETE